MNAERTSLRSTWPLHRRQCVQLVVGWAILTAVWIGIGSLLTGPLAHGVVVRADERVARWMVEQRTPTWNGTTVWGSQLAETLTKVVVTALLAVVFVVRWRRWFESVFVVVALIVEAAAFISVTTIVGRNRPDVARLDGSPVGSSFPSGHTAAAAAYVAFAVVVFWHTRHHWARVAIVIVTVLVPVIVALSRMYRGMHFLSDTVAGAILGGASVALTAVVLARSPEGVRLLHPAPVVEPTDDLASLTTERIVV